MTSILNGGGSSTYMLEEKKKSKSRGFIHNYASA